MRGRFFRVTIVGSICNFLLLLKFAAGVLGHSAAMIADAVHSLSDFVTDIVVLVFVRISGRPQDKDHDITRVLEDRIRCILGQDSFINIHVEPAKNQ